MTELNCSLPRCRSRSKPMVSSSLADQKRVRSLRLHPSARSEFVASRQCNLRASVSRAADLQEEMAGQRFSVQTSAMREQKDQ